VPLRNANRDIRAANRTAKKENHMQSRDIGSIQGTASIAAILDLLIADLAGFVHRNVPGAPSVPAPPVDRLVAIPAGGSL
jgi:hypothetical protein